MLQGSRNVAGRGVAGIIVTVNSVSPNLRQGVLAMSNDDVTQWIRGFAEGDELAAQKLWERYYSQLVSLARRKLGSRRRVVDEEDAALSAFNSFCQGLRAGRFPRIEDRHDLWKVLLTLTVRKTVKYHRREHAEKRGAGQVRGESVFAKRPSADETGGMGAILGSEPTPELAAQVADQCEHLLAQLDDESQRQIALLKLEGYTDQEISEQLRCGLRTVQRKLARIRDKWTREPE